MTIDSTIKKVCCSVIVTGLKVTKAQLSLRWSTVLPGNLCGTMAVCMVGKGRIRKRWI